jgi:hypothetical protein
MQSVLLVTCGYAPEASHAPYRFISSYHTDRVGPADRGLSSDRPVVSRANEPRNGIESKPRADFGAMVRLC